MQPLKQTTIVAATMRLRDRSIGVVEYWYLENPTLQYSFTPVLHFVTSVVHLLLRCRKRLLCRDLFRLAAAR